MDKPAKTLKSVYIGRLTQPEFSQFIDRQIMEIELPGSDVLTDIPMNLMLAALKTAAAEFGKVILFVRKSPFSELLAAQDKLRENAFKQFKLALGNFRYSNDKEELKSYRKLLIIFTTFGDLHHLNFEAQTIEMKKLIELLEGENFNNEISKLNLASYVSRMKTRNEDFNQLFGSRSHEKSIRPVIDTLKQRMELQKQYEYFTGYILAMAHTMDVEPFNGTLKIMNSVRSYYDELIKRRQGVRMAARERKKKDAEPEITPQTEP